MDVSPVSLDISSIPPYLLLLSAVVSALVGALTSQFFNLYMAKSNRRWQETRHLITCCEKFCDDLLECAGQYWFIDLTPSYSITGKPMNNKAPEARILSGKITASIVLIANFIEENFTHDINIQKMLKKMIEEVTGGDFGVQFRPADHDRVARSIGSIVKLRGALANAKQKH